MGLHDISIKFAQANFYKCMTWLRKTKERMLKVDKGIYQCGYVTMKTKDPYENVMRFYQVGIEFCFHD